MRRSGESRSGFRRGAVHAVANCKACNTRMPASASACPHCGHPVPKPRFIDSLSSGEGDAPGESESPLAPLSPSNAQADESLMEPVSDLTSGDARDEVELPLDDVMAMGRRSKQADRAAAEPAAEPEQVAPASQPREARAGLIPLSAEQVRHLVGEQPELLEPGLRVLGEEGRRQLGAAGGADLGEIDWLARSDGGDWVVVVVAEGSPGPSLLSDVLRAVGWVGKHLCDDGDAARGIVLIESLDEEFGYAASAVGETVSFRTWRASVAFEPIEA